MIKFFARGGVHHMISDIAVEYSPPRTFRVPDELAELA